MGRILSAAVVLAAAIPAAVTGKCSLLACLGWVGLGLGRVYMDAAASSMSLPIGGKED